MVFDLDGTLIDNRRAIIEAYRLVGVNEGRVVGLG
jgi:phosphoglycolate phosphatase-like HAD superfamily hydrolase